MAQEIALWRAVIRRALADATQDLDGVPQGTERKTLLNARDEARAWLSAGDADFQEVCTLAAIEPTRFRHHVDALKERNWHLPRPARNVSAGFRRDAGRAIS